MSGNRSQECPRRNTVVFSANLLPQQALLQAVADALPTGSTLYVVARGPRTRIMTTLHPPRTQRRLTPQDLSKIL
jgi:hypothetical protein